MADSNGDNEHVSSVKEESDSNEEKLGITDYTEGDGQTLGDGGDDTVNSDDVGDDSALADSLHEDDGLDDTLGLGEVSRMIEPPTWQRQRNWLN